MCPLMGVFNEWPDSSGNDDHGRAGSGGGKRGMSEKDMASLKAGDKVSYDDGRPGHQGKMGDVLGHHRGHAVVQFEDRASPNVIGHGDKGWTDHLRKE